MVELNSICLNWIFGFVNTILSDIQLFNVSSPSDFGFNCSFGGTFLHGFHSKKTVTLLMMVSL